MAPVYSKGGCATCKRRKKKCGEEKPVCSQCTRLGLQCTYQREPSYKSYDSISPTAIVRALPSSGFYNKTEEAILCQITGKITSGFTPGCLDEIKDLSRLFQMIIEEEVIRCSAVACFSSMIGHSQECEQLHSWAYGHALRLLRSRVDSEAPNEENAIIFPASVTFLSLLNDTRQGASHDPTGHYKEFAKLLVYHDSEIVGDRSPLDRNAKIVLLEIMTCHITCAALFSGDVSSMSTLWQESRISERLETVNPKGPNRIINSPFLFGEYDIYQLILEVTCILRSTAQKDVGPAKIDALESTIRELASSFETRFASLPLAEVEIHHQQAILEIHRSLVASLLICLVTLRGESEEGGKAIDSLAKERLHVFINFPMFEDWMGAYLWSLAILACAIRHNDDFKKFEDRLVDLKSYLYPGQRERLEAVVSAVRELRIETKAANEQRQAAGHIPVGLSLLKRSMGILS